MKTTARIVMGETVTFSETFAGKRRSVKHAQWLGRRSDGSLVAECCKTLDEAVCVAIVAIARGRGEHGSVADILAKFAA